MKRITVGIFGFGKAGKSVAGEVLKEENFELKWVVRSTCKKNEKYASRFAGLEKDEGKIYSNTQVDEDFYRRQPVDIIIDFSDTSGVRYYQAAADCGTRIISAVSKYEAEDHGLLVSLAEKTAVLYSPNITLGINVLMVASQVLQKIAPRADIEIVEEHFRGKTEVSGTARKIADALGLGYDHINSVRAGGIVGRHEIIFGMPNQTIRLTHESISRAAFGQGAVFAAKYLINQPTGIYTMDNVIAGMFRENLPVY